MWKWVPVSLLTSWSSVDGDKKRWFPRSSRRRWISSIGRIDYQSTSGHLLTTFLLKFLLLKWRAFSFSQIKIFSIPDSFLHIRILPFEQTKKTSAQGISCLRDFGIRAHNTGKKDHEVLTVSVKAVVPFFRNLKVLKHKLSHFLKFCVGQCRSTEIDHRLRSPLNRL